MNHCLNCTETLSAPYCPYCGQKASTHRYSVKHFIEHDLIHGILHIDKGILFTIKMLFTRPGDSIREFIQGKRVGYFNFITLMVIILGATHFISALSPFKLADIVPENTKAAISVMEEFSTKYPKVLFLITIPVSSLFSFLWFRKARLNATEHLVMNVYKASAEMILSIPFLICTIFIRDTQILYVLYNISSGVLGSLYTIWLYSQLFSAYDYKPYQLVLRSIMVLVSIGVFYAFLGIVAGIIMGLLAR